MGFVDICQQGYFHGLNQLLNHIYHKMMSLIHKNIIKFGFSQSIVLQYRDLKDGKDLTGQIETAFGPKGHGILFVDGVPDFVQIRKHTLPLFSKLANLPAETLRKYERPEIFHSLGWSHGVEKFQGKYDTSKGSYYFNACTDTPIQIKPQDKHLFTEDEMKMFVSNRWVDEIPEIQYNVKAMSKLMISVGVLLARQIDKYASAKIPTYKHQHLETVIREGQGHIGRMLHYFPFEEKGEAEGDWCGWHNDHGSLTALTPAMYLDENGKQVVVESQSGGLFAKNRFSEMAKIAIPKHMMGFQLGESTQIHTGGFLEATPHCVIRNAQLAGKRICRNAFPLFMEPNFPEVMKTPEGIDPENVYKTQHKIPQIRDRWVNGMLFKDFHLKTIKYYS